MLTSSAFWDFQLPEYSCKKILQISTHGSAGLAKKICKDV
jgi:hypothetical protein